MKLNNVKKIIAFILTLTILMSMIIPAYAAESTVSHEIVTIGDREVEVTTIFSDHALLH